MEGRGFPLRGNGAVRHIIYMRRPVQIQRHTNPNGRRVNYVTEGLHSRAAGIPHLPFIYLTSPPVSSEDTLKYFGFIGHFSEVFLYIEYFCTRIRTIQREKLEGTTSSLEANTIVKKKTQKGS
jgi:hypothetical protein